MTKKKILEIEKEINEIEKEVIKLSHKIKNGDEIDIVAFSSYLERRRIDLSAKKAELKSVSLRVIKREEVKMRGKLIVIEGTDGSGKATQSKLLYEKLKEQGKKVRLISFPNYKSDSSSLVKMYLSGEFGANADEISSYASSSFFAVDRVASYLKDWKKDIEDGCIIICDRYTQSNMIHQAAKLNSYKEKVEYINWLKNYEFNLMGIPSPDMVIFLRVEPKVSLSLRKDREEKINGDIHENDEDFMEKSFENACEVAMLEGWETVICSDDENMKEIDEIASEIFQRISKIA